MSNRYWLLGLAVGGWLAVGAALPGEGVTQTPERERVAGGSPSNEEKSGGQTNDRQHPSREFAIPFRVVEDPTDAFRAQEREAKADQRESDDLDAQQRAAAAAERGAVAAEGQEKAAWAQSVFGLVSVILVFCALRQTNRSLKIARDANQLTREQMIASQRAWAFIDNVRIVFPTKIIEDAVVIKYVATVKCGGATPAMAVALKAEAFVFQNQEKTIDTARVELRAFVEKADKFPCSTIFSGSNEQYENIVVSKFDRSALAIENEMNVGIIFCLRYQVVGLDQPRFTEETYGLISVPLDFAVKHGHGIKLDRLGTIPAYVT